MIILGIDPGTATMGYGVIRKVKTKLEAIDYGCITTDRCLSDAERLRIINNALSKLIKKHRPNALAVENVYFFKNLKTVMSVSQAKGVVLLTAAKNKLPICEFAPLQIKLVVAGYGRAKKPEMQEKIKILLNLSKIPKPDDAADALAVASTYFLTKKTKLT